MAVGDTPARPGSFSTLCGIGPDADVRTPQLLLLVPVLVGLALRAAGVWSNPFSLVDLAGWTVLALVTIAAVGMGTGWLPTRRTLWLPVLDIAGIGLLHLTAGSTIGLTLVLPVIWLGLWWRRRGALIAIASVAAMLTVQLLAGDGPSSSALAAAVLVLLTTGLCAGVVATVSASWLQYRAALERSRVEVERSNAELRLRRSLQEAVMTSAEVGLGAVMPDGEVSAVNARQERFLALAMPFGRGGPQFVFGPDGRTPMLRNRTPFARAQRGEEFEEALVWVGEHRRERRALVVSVRVVTDEAGRFQCAVMACHDVTDLLTALRRSDDFISTMSHELRTPVTNIVGYLDLALSDIAGLPADVRPSLETAARNAERLVQLVSDILQAGQSPGTEGIERESVRLSELVRDCCQDTERKAEAAGVRVVCRVDQHPIVVGDARRLRQMLGNLVTNAITASDAGGEVTVSLLTAGHDAIIRVQDAGLGIPEDEVGHVFGRFYRTRAARRLAIQGVGLGLAICKDIAQAHDGSIEVHSVEGAGSVFEVRLPIAMEISVAG